MGVISYSSVILSLKHLFISHSFDCGDINPNQTYTKDGIYHKDICFLNNSHIMNRAGM